MEMPETDAFYYTRLEARLARTESDTVKSRRSVLTGISLGAINIFVLAFVLTSQNSDSGISMDQATDQFVEVYAEQVNYWAQ